MRDVYDFAKFFIKNGALDGNKLARIKGVL